MSLDDRDLAAVEAAVDLVGALVARSRQRRLSADERAGLRRLEVLIRELTGLLAVELEGTEGAAVRRIHRDMTQHLGRDAGSIAAYLDGDQS
ncbi:MAG: hypothetical protein EPO00_10570 [Chloroflexota bacterium]|nr:MAG: hypothetical protein EPO00_10570 [Chloroflexota bacterium]